MACIYIVDQLQIFCSVIFHLWSRLFCLELSLMHPSADEHDSSDFLVWNVCFLPERLNAVELSVPEIELPLLVWQQKTASTTAATSHLLLCLTDCSDIYASKTKYFSCCSLQIEAESLPEISSRYNIVAVPTCILLKVSFCWALIVWF